MTNVTAENYYYFNCEVFGMYDYYSYCQIYYTVESCDLANNTCEMWYNDYNYNYNQHDCGEDLKNETWWNMQQNNSVWFNTSQPELYYVWQNWNDYHHGVGDMDEHVDDFSDWLWDDVFETDEDHQLHENPRCGMVDGDTLTSFECSYVSEEAGDQCWVFF